MGNLYDFLPPGDPEDEIPKDKKKFRENLKLFCKQVNCLRK